MIVSKLSGFSKNQKLVYFLIGLGGGIICQLLFSTLQPRMTAQGYSILDLEFAWTSSNLDSILTAWSPVKNDVITYMFIDMLFPIFYFLGLNGWSLLVNFEGKSLKIVTLAAFLAIIFDYIENIFTFIVLFDANYIFIAPFMITLCAILKFLLIIFVILRNLAKMIIKK